jgi:hypothetical protein
MQVRLLGPVDVVVDDEPRPVHGVRRKAILAVLALNHGTVISSYRITDLVWGAAPPPTAPNTLQAHVSCRDGASARPGPAASRSLICLTPDKTGAPSRIRTYAHGSGL